MKLHESIGRGASKNKSMGMRDAHSISLIVLSVMKKFVDQVCPHFPILGDVNPSVFTFHVPSKKPARSDVSLHTRTPESRSWFYRFHCPEEVRKIERGKV